MHYHTEVWLPEVLPYDEAVSMVEEILDPFCFEGEGKRTRPFMDYFDVGGRWTGAHTNYDPQQNPDNYQTCDMCEGSGNRSDGSPYRGCNVCNGTGLKIKWSLVPYEGDVITPDKLPDDYHCYTFVYIKNGKTHVTHDETWQRATKSFKKSSHHGNVKVLMKKHGLKGGCLVTVDYHS